MRSRPESHLERLLERFRRQRRDPRAWPWNLGDGRLKLKGEHCFHGVFHPRLGQRLDLDAVGSSTELLAEDVQRLSLLSGERIGHGVSYFGRFGAGQMEVTPSSREAAESIDVMTHLAVDHVRADVGP